MKIIEHRRHAKREKPFPHLSQAGVKKARQLGAKLGPFVYVATSDLPRAIETAVAMGFAVDEECAELSRYVDAIDRLISRKGDFAAIARALLEDVAARRMMKALRAAVIRLLKKIPEGGRLLLISHGGIIEATTIACLPDADYSDWGTSLKLLEGTELLYSDGKFSHARRLKA